MAGVSVSVWDILHSPLFGNVAGGGFIIRQAAFFWSLLFIFRVSFGQLDAKYRKAFFAAVMDDGLYGDRVFMDRKRAKMQKYLIFL